MLVCSCSQGDVCVLLFSGDVCVLLFSGDVCVLLFSGDVARVDKDGFYFIVDRIKELIKYKGNQVRISTAVRSLLRYSN